MAIYYIDEIMGRGKTSAMINFVNDAPESERFLFITPLLSEVERIQRACSRRGFIAPREEHGKLNNIKILLDAGNNIVSTHSLFSMFDEDTIKSIMEHQYTLIIDEAMAVSGKVDITKYDAEIILGERDDWRTKSREKYAEVDEETRLITWTKDDYTGRLLPYKDCLDTGLVYWYNSTNWIKLFPVELFLAFKDIYIMTYMFEHQFQRCYFDLFGLPYQRKYITGDSPETYRLSDEYEPSPKIDFTHLIHVLDNKKLNRIGEANNAFSKNWYLGKRYGAELKTIKNNLINFFQNIQKSPSSKNLWTTFCKDTTLDDQCPEWPKILSGNGYAKGFLACNAKGTNMYRNKTSLAYMVNIYPNVVIRNFFHARGVPIDEDMYATSEMVQWIWRSAIRDGKEITVYVPSSRMRRLLMNWIEACKTGGTID